MRKSLQTKVGSPLTRMIIAHNLKNCYARLTPSKKKLLTFLTAVASFKYLHAILHAKLTRSFQGVKKKYLLLLLKYFLLWILPDVLLYYHYHVFLDSISEKKKKGCNYNHNMNFFVPLWQFSFLLLSIIGSDYHII